MKRQRMIGSVGSAVAVAVLLILSGLPMKGSSEQTRGEQVILVVAELDRMKTRNPLPASADNVWTRDVLDRVYDTVGKALPEAEQLVPYILRGVDVDNDGVFEINEFGKFEKANGADQLNITAYYDFNGVYFHDGVQATPGDLFFSYQLQAMNPRMRVDLLPLMDKAGRAGSNNTATRWLFVTPAIKSWQNESTYGDSSLRFAVRFQLQEPFALFYRSTLAGCILYPSHVWEGSGWRADVATGGMVSPLHPDFGLAIYPESDPRFGLGIPTTETTYTPFVYLKSDTPSADSAEEWQLTDADVIGTGPFRFASFDEQQAVALVLKNPYFFTGKDETTGQMIDSFVASYVHQPYIDGILFVTYNSATLCLLAFKKGRVDFCHISFPPEYVLGLTLVSDYRLWSNPDSSFTYVGYNMRRPSIGTWHWGQGDQFDIGLHFRKAVAHLVDKPTILKNFLQGYGDRGIVPIPPGKRFYNTSLTPYTYNKTLAEEELTLAHQDAVWLSGHSGPPEASTWFSRDAGTGKIIMPEIGTVPFSLMCLLPDYDVFPANACQLIWSEMRAMGFNVTVRSPSFEGIINLVTLRDFDMYLLGWNIGDDDPDYLYDFFHSSNAASGLNYGGFNDPTMDWVLESSRREMNETRRIELIKWAEGIIADKLPYDTIAFRNNIEATRQSKFVGWRPVHGSVWNYWSLLAVRPPITTHLRVSIEGPSAVAAGGTAGITVSVKDQNGAPVEGAQVHVMVTPEWAGNLSFGGEPPANNITATAYLGRLQLSYIAPSVESVLNVTITTVVNHPDYVEIGRSFVIMVYPSGEKFLAVTLEFLDSDLVAASNSIRFGISVSNPLGFPADDAWLNAVTVPAIAPPYGLFPSQGNATSMGEVTFRAPPADQLSQNESFFVVAVNATAPGYSQGISRAGFIVVKLFRTCLDGSRLPLEGVCPEQSSIAPWIVAAFTGLVAVAAASVLLRKREK